MFPELRYSVIRITYSYESAYVLLSSGADGSKPLLHPQVIHPHYSPVTAYYCT